MANEIEIVVRGTNRSQSAFREPAADADKLKAKLSGTDEVMLKLMADFNRTGEGASKFGRTLTDDGNFAKFLDERLVNLRTETGKLGVELNRTGNIDVFKKIKDNESATGTLTKIRAGLVDALKQAGQTGGQEFVKNFSAEAQSVESNPISGPVIGVAIANGIVAASPIIGAALDGALLAGIGLGGVALGIIGQIHDPAVQAAAEGAGHSLMATLGADTAPFRDPLIEAIGDVEASLSHLLDGIHFDKLASAIGPLERGIDALFTKMGPGLSSAFDAAVPVLVALGDELPGLGAALSSFFQSLANGSEGGAEGLRTLFWILDKTIVGVGNLIMYASEIYDGFVKAGAEMNQWATDLVGGVPVIGTYVNKVHDLFDAISGGDPSMKELSRSLGDVSGNASAVTDAVRKMSTEFDTAFGKTMALDTANAKFKEDLLGMKSALDQHSSSLRDNSLAGLHNQDVVRGMIQDAENARQAFIDQAGGANASQSAIDQANAAYENAIQQIITMGVKAGLSKDQLQALVGQYDINLVYTTTYVTRGTPPRTGDYSDIPTGRIGGRASGGIASGIASGLSWVGEQGRELVKLPPGSQVYSHGDSERMSGAASGSSGGGGDSARTVNFIGDTDRAFARLFAQLVRDRLIVIN